jgi:hypothetical protein
MVSRALTQALSTRVSSVQLAQPYLAFVRKREHDVATQVEFESRS